MQFFVHLFILLAIAQCQILYSHWIYQDKRTTVPALERSSPSRGSQTCKLIAMYCKYMLEILQVESNAVDSILSPGSEILQRGN